MRHLIALLGMLGVIATVASCADGTDNGCEKARVSIQGTIDGVCKEPAFTATGFCRTCRANGLYSTTDAASCTCKPLNFDQDFCVYKSDQDAVPQVRAAIEHANAECAEFTIEAPGDAGAAGAAGTGGSAGSAGAAGGQAGAAGGS